MYKFKTNTYVFTYEHLKQLDKKYILRLGYVYIANMLRSVAQWPAAIVSDGFSFEKKLNGFRFETHEPVTTRSIWLLLNAYDHI